MEWIEITARTVEDAKELALDRLMVDEDDVEFDIVEQPRAGLFGRLRGEARVRARVKPTPVRQKVERRDRRRGGRRERAEGGEPSGDPSSPTTPVQADVAATDAGRAEEGSPAPTVAGPARTEGTGRNRRKGSGGGGRTATSAVSNNGNEHKEQDVDKEPQDPQAAVARVGEEATRFIEGLVSSFGLDAVTKLGVDGNELEVTVEGEHLGLLVGPRGSTLQAVQDLARVASQRRLHDHDTRLRIDIAGYRRRRSESLSAFVAQIAEDVQHTGVARVLEPMSSADRKVIHDSLTGIAGVETRSEGEEPFRRVVIAPSTSTSTSTGPSHD